MKLDTVVNFEEMEFPRDRDIVYVLHYLRQDNTEGVPFYVGESSRHVGRFGDYVSANFTASTDFKVGEAVKYLRENRLRVVIKYKVSNDRKGEEKSILKELRVTFRLLNDLKGYRYGDSSEDEERLKIHQFIDQILENPRRIGTNTQPQRVPDSTTVIRPHTLRVTSGDIPLSVPERIRLICQDLGAGGRVITRHDILRLAKEQGINESSVLPADYCDNTQTGKWSGHSFLHSVGRGRYVLIA